jgi:hypothetical protein
MIIYRHNTGKHIDQLTFRVSLEEALFKQFTDTERKVAGRRVAENIIPWLKAISSTNIPHVEKINTAEELHGMHGFVVDSGMSSCVWVNVLKPIIQNLIPETIKSF